MILNDKTVNPYIKHNINWMISKDDIVQIFMQSLRI